MTGSRRRFRKATALVGMGTVAEAVLVWLGRTYGSTPAERGMDMPGDDIVPRPQVVTNHAITIDAAPELVWPWLVQMGWHRAGWYTARWVDRLLFPANWPSANRIIPELQDTRVGSFIPDGAPETECGMIVEHLEPDAAMVLHSTSHLPAGWRARHRAALDWSWAFVLVPLDGGRRTRFLFRSRWTTAPWWLTLGGWLAIVPADFVMSRDMLRGVKQRAEHLAAQRVETDPESTSTSGLTNGEVRLHATLPSPWTERRRPRRSASSGPPERSRSCPAVRYSVSSRRW